MLRLHQFSGLNQKLQILCYTQPAEIVLSLNELFLYIVHKQVVELFIEGGCEC